MREMRKGDSEARAEDRWRQPGGHGAASGWGTQNVIKCFIAERYDIKECSMLKSLLRAEEAAMDGLTS